MSILFHICRALPGEVGCFFMRNKNFLLYFDLLSLSFYMLIFVKLGVGGGGGLILGYGMGLN